MTTTMARHTVFLSIVFGLVFASEIDGEFVRDTGNLKPKEWDKAPGLKARITPSGITFWETYGESFFMNHLADINIPPFEGSAHVPVIGSVHYYIDNVRIFSFAYPAPTFVTSPDVQGFTFYDRNIYFSIAGNWRYTVSRLPSLSGSGYFDLKASEITIKLTMRVGMDSAGRPSIFSGSSDCYFIVGKIEFSIDGGSKWFYNLFQNKIVNQIKNAMNGQTCGRLINAINNDAENKLRSLPMTFPIKNMAILDYSLVKRPNITQSMDTAHKGEVYSVRSRSECPLPVQEIPPDSDTSRMMFFWITEFLPNSAGYALQNAGYLRYNVTPDDIPPAERGYLNTSCRALHLLIPKIGKLYPDMGMQVSLNSTKAPVVSIKPSGIDATLEANISPYAILPNKTLAHLFTINAVVQTQLTLGVKKNNNITWTISSIRTKLSLVRSDVGHISATELQIAVNAAMKFKIIKQLNQYGDVGISLPKLPKINVTTLAITHDKGFLKIGTDLKYAPN